MKNILLYLLLIPILSFSQYGVLDDTFGIGGIAVNDNLPSEVNARWSLALAVDGNKNSYTATNFNYDNNLTGYNDGVILSKFLPNGQLDSSFAENGYRTVKVQGGLNYVQDLLVSYDNYLYAIGGIYLNEGSQRKLMVLKLDLNGNYVSGFGDNGMALFNLERGMNGGEILETADGDLLIGGNFYRDDNFNPAIAILKINSNGNLIPNFGDDGVVKFLYNNFDVLRDLKLYIDGGFQVLTYSSNNLSDFDNFFVKFHADGSLDTSFNSTGVKVISQNSNNGYEFESIQLKNNERIVFSYNSFDGTLYSMNLMEILPNGEFNTNFGNAGVVSTYLNNLISGEYLNFQRTFVVTPDGQHIIQIGFTWQNGENFTKSVLVAYDENGNYDTHFGTNAVNLTKIHPSKNDEPTKAVFVGNDRMLVLNGTHLSLARFIIYEGLLVEEISENSKIKIAPNPASNSFVINGLDESSTQIQIIDMTGKLVKEFKSVKNGQTLDLGTVNKGVYYIKILSDYSWETKKLIVK